MEQAQGMVTDVRVGPAVSVRWRGREFVTGAAKASVIGPVHAGRLGLAGDQQGNLKVHGGPDKAILLYSANHYPRWHEDGFAVPVGGFFENLVIDGLDERSVHLGDIWQIGGVLAQVTQPRRPCRTLADRWDRPSLPAEVTATGRSGWYVRVLDEGSVAAGDAVVLLERLPGSVSAAEASRVMDVDRTERAGIRRLLAAPELPASWREKLARRLHRQVEDHSAR